MVAETSPCATACSTAPVTPRRFVGERGEKIPSVINPICAIDE